MSSKKFKSLLIENMRVCQRGWAGRPQARYPKTPHFYWLALGQPGTPTPHFYRQGLGQPGLPTPHFYRQGPGPARPQARASPGPNPSLLWTRPGPARPPPNPSLLSTGPGPAQPPNPSLLSTGPGPARPPTPHFYRQETLTFIDRALASLAPKALTFIDTTWTSPAPNP